MEASTCSDGRHIMAPGSFNLRDLGGLPSVDGRWVRRGLVYRSDYPGLIAPELFADLGLRAVVDLRRGSEVAVECPDWAVHGIDHRRWPLTAGAQDSWHARYTSYLTHRPETVVGAVAEVMRPDGHAVLFHCAAGKDRTGVVAALLLSVLGVPDDAIVDDYLLSAASVERVIGRLVTLEVYAAMLADSSVEDQLPRPEHLRSLLAWLSERGGAEGWLRAQGLDQGVIDGFREAMLER